MSGILTYAMKWGDTYNPIRTYIETHWVPTDTWRGQPGRNELVHLKVATTRPGYGTGTRPLCFNGAYHLEWNVDPAKVTCPACLEKLKKEKLACELATANAPENSSHGAASR